MSLLTRSHACPCKTTHRCLWWGRTSQRLTPSIAISHLQTIGKEECYLNLPPDSVVDNPLDMDAIKEQQEADNELQNQAAKYADRYIRKSVSAVDNVLCYVKPGDPPANWKIALPRPMLQLTIRWFHEITGHPGSKRLHMQIST